MCPELMDRGKILSLELIGAEYIDESVSYYTEFIEYSGMLLGFVIENHQDNTVNWDSESLEIIDASGFVYTEGYSDAASHLEEFLPGGWYNDLYRIKPNRKYRYAVFIDDFHADLGLISYEKEIYLAQTSENGSEDHIEQIEIDLSHLSEEDISGLSEIVTSIQSGI